MSLSYRANDNTTNNTQNGGANSGLWHSSKVDLDDIGPGYLRRVANSDLELQLALNARLDRRRLGSWPQEAVEGLTRPPLALKTSPPRRGAGGEMKRAYEALH